MRKQKAEIVFSVAQHNSFLLFPLIRLRRLESALARHSLSKLNSALAYSQISSFSFLFSPFRL